MNAQTLTRLLQRMHGEYNRTADGSLAFPTEPEEIRSLCEQIRTYLPEYELSDDDILAISQIFGGRNSNGACLPVLPTDIFLTSSLQHPHVMVITA